MEFKTLTLDNLETEHICCAITEKKGENCVPSKKAWLRERIGEGLVFRKLDVRGKVFIEYLPMEAAWIPAAGEGYMYIDCLWVSGKYKGQGYGDQLLSQCIEDSKAKGKKGLAVLSSKKKMAFLSDPKYLKYKGFRVADQAEPYFELLYLPFEEGIAAPRFRDCARDGRIDEKGWVLYYSNQCPHTEKYAPLIAQMAEAEGVDFKLVKIESREQAQNAPTPFTTYSMFHDGSFVTNEILSEKKFERMIK
ncbi:GNAT family N-acetyltransferase [Anaerovorax odorimutans]|uniref:GNAT family N-acetyltransferase n=1 Tax=Anaerovorax odorimutans TaxID=109327 RepID=A0ABT1RP10_9FIRM|nr:GNAT family N-acetyltransferase [Anaerovorax odorimutans]MCQ4636908.1 GNAT family N-acetyltransferase [Anaerovorax odorimutans]